MAASDRNPVEYVYLSRRLLTEVRQSDEAVRPPRRRRFRLGPSWASREIESADRDPDNLQALARRSSELVADNTGDLERPGRYFRAQLPLRLGVFETLLGWRGGAVATFLGETTSAENGQQIRVVLIGSASNAVGHRPDPTGSGFYPSAICGLYALLDAVREEGDPEVELDYRIDDLEMDTVARAETAVRLAGDAGRYDLGIVDFLAQGMIDVDVAADVRVLIGSPLWVATPQPRAVART